MLFDHSTYLFADCEKHRIAYQRSGKGIPVLMIHGITTYSFIWRKLIPELEKQYDLIRVDLLGCGSSEISAGNDLSLKNHAKILIDFMDQLNLDAVHLVGHDIGGGICQIMGVDHPNRFRSISLLNPVGYNFWPVSPITVMRTPVFRQFAMAAFDIGYYKSIIRKALYKQQSFTTELMDLFWSNFDSPNAKKSFLQFAKCLNNNDLMEIEGRLKKIDIPVLIMRADSDKFLSIEITNRLHNDIPNSKLIVLTESGHYMQEDSPTEINYELIKFWSSL